MTTLSFERVKDPKAMIFWFLGHPLVEWAECRNGKVIIDIDRQDVSQLEQDMYTEFGYVSEGTVSAAQSDMVGTINSVVSEIARFADGFGYETEYFFVRDLDRGDRIAGKIEIEVETMEGKAPQVVEITVYDDDDLVAEVPRGIAQELKILNYIPMKNSDEAKSFIEQFAKKVGNEPRQPDDQE